MPLQPFAVVDTCTPAEDFAGRYQTIDESLVTVHNVYYDACLRDNKYAAPLEAHFDIFPIENRL